MRVIDIGCGNKKTPGAIGVDKFPLEQVDIVFDISALPWPLKDGSVDRIICNHILEHLRVEQRVKVLREIHRVMRPEGELVVRIPHGACRNARLDPTHVDIHGLHLSMFDYYEKSHRFSYYFDYHFVLGKKEIVKSVLAWPRRLPLISGWVDKAVCKLANRWEYILWLVPLRSSVVYFALKKSTQPTQASRVTSGEEDSDED
jgi:SAM-dependent methyltransferase